MVHIVASEKRMDETYRSVGVKPFRIVYEEMLDSKAQLLQRTLAHLFPKRNLPVSQLNFSDATRKLAGEDENNQEIDFVERHAKQINALYEIRNASDIGIEDLDAALQETLGHSGLRFSPGRRSHAIDDTMEKPSEF